MVDPKLSTAVSVTHEWGALKESIVGIGEDIMIPEWIEGYGEYITPKVADLAKRNAGKMLRDVDSKSEERTIEQVEGFVDVLKDNGVKVYRSTRLTEEEFQYLGNLRRGNGQLYPRDPIVVIGNNIIETSLRDIVRRKERFGIRRALEARIHQSNANYVSMLEPYPVSGDSAGFSQSPFLEGGDVLLNGHEIFVGISGHGSNEAGVDWLRNFLGPQYRIQPISLSRHSLHLDTAMMMCRPGLAVISPDALLEGIPPSLKHWEFIEVTSEEASRLATNFLVLDENTCIIDKQHSRIGEALRKKGQNVIFVAYDQVSRWGGAFRCSHHPLIRES